VLAAEEKIIFDWAQLDERVMEWSKHDLRIGFTNGCFDLLHPGHVHLLTQARAACDRLIVGLNSDASVARLKGADRPIQEVHARALVLAALEAVDLVVVFEQDTPLELLHRVRPRVLVKGADYRPDEVVGRALVEADGGQVVLVDVLPGHSTSAIVRKSAGPPNRRETLKKPKVVT
jgi:D-beta-D-heptose 7-phosphate kinase/D-beta-D-heptose 1-phosphate adenosyltransferase